MCKNYSFNSDEWFSFCRHWVRWLRWVTWLLRLLHRRFLSGLLRLLQRRFLSGRFFWADGSLQRWVPSSWDEEEGGCKVTLDLIQYCFIALIHRPVKQQAMQWEAEWDTLYKGLQGRRLCAGPLASSHYYSHFNIIFTHIFTHMEFSILFSHLQLQSKCCKGCCKRGSVLASLGCTAK